MLELADWDSFCVIVGSAAGALIGLQFVVMRLIAARPERPTADAGGAFATPTIVHFCAVLFLAAVLRAPWKTILPAAIVARRMKAQNVYKPELEDWLFYVWLPSAAYVALAASTLTAFAYTREALFGVGASMLLLLFVGIRNAWNSVAYHVFVKEEKTDEDNRCS